MSKRGPMPVFKTMDEYISQQSPEAQERLQELRSIIKIEVPEAEEVINYQIPAFSLVKNGKRNQQLMMAAYEKFIGFYPFPTTMAHFKEELKDYKQGKGSVQFPFEKELPKELIRKMVRFRKEEIEREFESKANK